MRQAVKSSIFAAALLLAAGTASANSVNASASTDDVPSAGAMAFDLAVVRPVGFITSILGTGIFILSLPIDIISGNISDPAHRLVVEPLQFTFTRDLGQLE